MELVRTAPGAAIAVLLLLAGCSHSGIPPVEVGDGEIRALSGPARDATDAYLIAYATLAPQHLRVRRCLEPRGQNLVGARAAMADIIDGLQTMQALAIPSQRDRFAPYLAQYHVWHEDIARNTWGGSFLQEFERTERDVKSRFEPGQIQIEAPHGPPPGEPSETAAAPTASTRLLFRAWERAHADLVTAFTNKKSTQAAYEEAFEALTLLKPNVPKEKAVNLQLYLGYYANLFDRTQGFSKTPEGATDQEILEELNVAARLVRGQFPQEQQN